MSRYIKEGIAFIKQRARQLNDKNYIDNMNSEMLNRVWPNFIVINLIFWLYRVIRILIILIYFFGTLQNVSQSPNPYIFDFLILPLPQFFHRVVLNHISIKNRPKAVALFLTFYNMVINAYLSQIQFTNGQLQGSNLFQSALMLLIMLQINFYLPFMLLRFTNQFTTFLLIFLSNIQINILDQIIVFFLFVIFVQWQWDNFSIKLINYKQFQKDYLANLPIALCILSQNAKEVLYVNKQLKLLTLADLATSTQYLRTQKKTKGEEIQNSENKLILELFANIYSDFNEVQELLPAINIEQQIVKDSQILIDLSTVIQFIGRLPSKIHKTYCFKSVQFINLITSPKKDMNNEKRFLDVRIQTGLNFGDSQSIIITVYDTSSLLQTLYYRNLNSVKDRLIKSISHELRTRLNIIQGMIQLLISSNLSIDSYYLNILQATYNNCQIQTYLIGGIIDYHLIQENQITSNIVRCSLKKLVDDSIQLFQEEADLKHIQITTQNQLVGERLFLQDASRIMICLVNLISNSLKFTHQDGHIQIVYSSENQLSPSPQNSFLKNKKKKVFFFQKKASNQSHSLQQSNSENSHFKRDRNQSSKKSKNQLSSFIQDKVKIIIIDNGVGMSETKLSLIQKIVQGDEEDLEISDEDQSQGFLLGIRVIVRTLNYLNEEKGQWLLFESVQNKGTSATMILKCGNKQINNSFNQLSQSHIQLQENLNLSNSIEKEGSVNQANQLVKQNLFQNFKLDLQELNLNFSEQCNCEQEILLVDDEPYNLFILEYLFKINNQKVLKAENGSDCVELVKKRIDKAKNGNHNCRILKAIFMDYQMPIKNGGEATIEISRIFKEYSENKFPRFPIIGCTGFSSANDVKHLLTAGMDEVLTKPITRQIIEEILARLNNKDFPQVSSEVCYQNIEIQ